MGQRHASVYFLTGAIFLAAGWGFYLFVRGTDPLNLMPDLSLWEGLRPGLLRASLPTFLHAVAFIFLCRAACSTRRQFWCFWLASTTGCELLQSVLPALGTFDVLDLASIALTIPLVFRVSRDLPLTGQGGQSGRLVVAALAGWTSLACAPAPRAVRITHTVKCMQLAELRSSFAVEAPRALTQSGRIFLHGNLLMISEPFKGIHVFDNSDPASPVAAAFLNIPGNTDIAVKDNYLYADSAVDLLTIRFDGNNASLAGRAEGVLTVRTPADFSNEDVYVPQKQIVDCTNAGGAVVGYEPREDGASFKSAIEENKND
jgi:hypothetical protein